ncbi:MAG: hypothetical protein K5786_03020 [Treponema sp.]|nr:hypothetical protein [Treponema sp.]
MRKFLVLFIAVIFSLVFIACDTPASTSTQNDDENTTITPTDDDTTQEPADTSSSDDTDDDEITAELDTTLEIPTLPESTGTITGSYEWVEYHSDSKPSIATFKDDYTVNVSGPNRFGEENSDFKYAYDGTYLYTLQYKEKGKTYEECITSFLLPYSTFLQYFNEEFKVSTEEAAGLYMKNHPENFDLDEFNVSSTATGKEIFRAYCDCWNRDSLEHLKKNFGTMNKFKIEAVGVDYTIQPYYEENYSFGNFVTDGKSTGSFTKHLSLDLRNSTSHIFIYDYTTQHVEFDGKFSGGLTESTGSFTAVSEDDSTISRSFNYSRVWAAGIFTYTITFAEDGESATKYTAYNFVDHLALTTN